MSADVSADMPADGDAARGDGEGKGEGGGACGGGAPPGTASGHRARRLCRAFLAVLVAAAVVVPLSGAARPRIPAPPPAALAPLTRSTLEAAYAANRANAALASRMAAAHGDTHRASADASLAAPGRHLLAFDGRGQGRATEVLGDLAHADRVAVLVPGSDTSLDTYGRFRQGALSLSRELSRQAPAMTRTAVVAWLGYETPGTVSSTVLTTGRAEQAAPGLRRLIHGLRDVLGRAPHITLVCHSYGSVVCGRAAAGLDVDDIALIGSPGTGADSVAELRTPARVWAARGAGDWVAHVPHVRADLLGTTLGLGADPMDPAFGARVFDAGRGGHSAYLTPGSPSLAHLGRIVLGTAEGGAR
ncbi:alpha/beta hydrolase [Streptomyces sp. NPDC004065]|uniref:alpha/beta hydrolase n=1 Tax=Streptomyces sp. NPDC004065 TaxID=3364689 RepID=UPI00384AE7E5